MKKIILLSSLLTLLCSCAFFKTTVGNNGTTHQYGKLQAIMKAPLNKVNIATAKAIKKMELLLTSHKKDAIFAVFEAKNAKDQEITINLEKISGTSSRVYIKVGMLGDHMFSQAIYDAIRESL
jgi:hypothetical protein